MESRTVKRKRCNKIKENVIEESHALVMNSAKLVDEIQAANEDFVEYFKSMGDRHSELISQAMGINEQYGGTKGQRAGETTKLHENLPTSYATDVRKFLDDTYTSLECHSKKYNQACEQIIREFETSFEAWKKISDIKEHGDKMQNQKAELREQFNEFKENVNP
ncbi:hypothetical protein ACET3Z_026511 [Daucus carota]